MDNLYTQLDFTRLTNDDIEKLIGIAGLEVPDGADKHDYIYKNRDSLGKIESANNIINQKVLAGSCAIKWYSFEYDNEFTMDKLIECLESENNNYNVRAVDLVGTIMDDGIVCISKDDNIYTIKLIIKDGMRRVADAITYRTEQNWSTVIAKIDVYNKWIEIRASGNLNKTAKRILVNSLKIKNVNEIEILHKYDHDVSKFKDSLNNGFYTRYRAMPTKNIVLTEDDGIALSKIIDAIDAYFIDKDSKMLLEKLDAIDYDMSEISLIDIFLAGIEKMSMKIRSDSTEDITKQGLYSVLKKDITEDTSYIKFDTDHNGVKYTNTIQVGRTTNSITFRTSVTEKEIEYIREKVI